VIIRRAISCSIQPGYKRRQPDGYHYQGSEWPSLEKPGKNLFSVQKLSILIAIACLTPMF
jgi:hypothetical protein